MHTTGKNFLVKVKIGVEGVGFSGNSGGNRIYAVVKIVF
jgi:hypothetical protein